MARSNFYNVDQTKSLLQEKANLNPTRLTDEDLNSLYDNGFYSQSANVGAVLSLNYPAPYAGTLSVVATDAKNISRQFYHPYKTSSLPVNSGWTRVSYRGVWSDWAEISGVSDAVEKSVTEILNRVGEPLLVDSQQPYEFAVGDSEGRPSWLQYDRYGRPTKDSVNALNEAGLIAADPGYGLVISGEDGTPTWLSSDAQGGPDSNALSWLANRQHFYVGQTAPVVHPGEWVLWIKTDHLGNPVDTLVGRN